MASASSDRPSVDQYFMDMTHLVKARGTCPRRQVGAVVVKDKRVLCTGYNGAPRNFPHPIDVGCLRDELKVPKGMMADICPCLHAEQNAILQAATTGVSIEGAELYCTTQPCTQCSRMLANCGITRVVFEDEYPDPLAIGILTTAGVQMARWDAQRKQARPYEKVNTFQQAQEALRQRWRAGDFQPSPPPLPVVPPSASAPYRPQPPPRAGSIPVQGAHAAPPAAPAPMDEPTASDPTEEAMAARAHVRDLTNDPQRAELIRKMARERVERERKKAQQDSS